MWKKKPKKNKKKKVRVVYAKFCPRCKSINVQITHQGGMSGLVAIGLPTMYRCMDCGFKNYSFPETKIEIPKKKEK
jgi:predicted RNA-binding Zn-ribbon protein involved in translation (DUF1610 family)